MIENKMIAVCDILGFKELIASNPLEKVIDNHFGYFRQALNFAINGETIPSPVPTLDELKNQDKIGFAWFSDTAILYNLEDNKEGHRKVIQTVFSLLFATIFSSHARIRVGISYGEMYIDKENDIYVGPALVEAYELEQDQEWSGACLTESAKKMVPDYVIKDNIYDWYLTEYYVPLKSMANKKPELRLAVDWTRGMHDTYKFEWKHGAEEPSPEEFQTNKEVIVKWKNTKAFHDIVCKYHSIKK